jgi:hypothetical protein
VVWSIGAEGTNRLYAYNGETGDGLFDGGGPDEQMTLVPRFQTPIAVNGHIIVAADNQLFVFTTQSTAGAPPSSRKRPGALSLGSTYPGSRSSSFR